MNAREFFDLVSSMRKAQKEYFASRSQSALNTSKQLEREVDKEINRVETILKIGAVQKEIEFDNQKENS